MKNKYSILIFLVACIFFPMVSGQSTVYFRHDASGNRDLRSITLITKSTKEDNKDEKREFTDKLGEKDIFIYPNPVKSELNITIPQLDDEQFASIVLYNLEGKIVYDNDHVSSSVIINLSDMPNGIYLLKIHIGEISTQWKIIKE